MSLKETTHGNVHVAFSVKDGAGTDGILALRTRVHISDDNEIEPVDGTKKAIGHVIVSNRVNEGKATVYTAYRILEDVIAGAAIAAGQEIRFGANGKVYPYVAEGVSSATVNLDISLITMSGDDATVADGQSVAFDTLNNLAGANNVAVAAGVVTLQPGTYLLEASIGGTDDAGAFGEAQYQFYDITGLTLIGTAGYTQTQDAGGDDAGPSLARAAITVAAGQTRDIELRMAGNTNIASVLAAFSSMKITKTDLTVTTAGGGGVTSSADGVAVTASALDGDTITALIK